MIQKFRFLFFFNKERVLRRLEKNHNCSNWILRDESQIQGEDTVVRIQCTETGT